MVKVICFILVFSFSIESTCYGLATLPASQNPIIKREILAALYRTQKIRYAETEDTKKLLAANNASCLLLSSGKYLVTKEVADNNIRLLRAIIHEDIKAIMRILSKDNKDKYKYQGIKELILKHFPPDENNKLPIELYVNHTVARVFEWLILIKDGIILESEIPKEEAAFIDAIKPIIMTNKHSYFTTEFWDSKTRGAKIKEAIYKGMMFYQVNTGGNPRSEEDIADKIYELYRDVKLQEHAEEISALGVTPLEVKNNLKNLLRDRFVRLLSSIPDNSIKFIGAGEKFIVFELANSGLVIKVPVKGVEYFGRVEKDLRTLRSKFGDHLAGTVEYLNEIKINISKLDPEAKKIMLNRIGDDVTNIKRDSRYNPIVDSPGNITVEWMLIQKKIDRLVNSDNFLFDQNYYKGVLEQAFRDKGKEGVKRIIDDLADVLKRDAYPRRVYPKEIKFSSFGYFDGKLALFDTDLGEREAQSENIFTTGILEILDPSGELSRYYKKTMSIRSDSQNSVAVKSRDLDFNLDGMNTETVQKAFLRKWLADKLRNPPYTIARDFNEKMSAGEDARSAIEKTLALNGIVVMADENIERNALCFAVIAEALSIMPRKALSDMVKMGFKAVNISSGSGTAAFIKYDNGVLTIHPYAAQLMGSETFLSGLYNCLGHIILSTLSHSQITALTTDFENIRMRGEYLREESADKGYNFIETKNKEGFTEYLRRFFTYYILEGGKLRQLVNGDVAYSETYDTIRPSIRRIYDLFKFSLGWKEYDSLELANLRKTLTLYNAATDLYDTKMATVLLTDLVYSRLQGERTYEIKYDISRLSWSQIEIIEEYVKLLQLRSSNPNNIKLRPFSSHNGSKESLIAVYCTGKDFKGEGHVDISIPEGELKDYLLRITGMVNIALASSNIPDNLSKEDVDKYRPILSYINNQYKAILGETLAIPDSPEDILKVIRRIVLSLPKSMRTNLGQIEEYNRLAKEALTAA